MTGDAEIGNERLAARMGEFGRSGPQLHHDEAAQREHLKEVQEDLQREHEADPVVRASHKWPWWRFWARRSG